MNLEEIYLRTQYSVFEIYESSLNLLSTVNWNAYSGVHSKASDH